MDILSHGLWGGITVGRGSRRSFWTAFAFGVMPDLFAFGPLFANRMLIHGLDFMNHLGRRPDPSTIPAYVHSVYNVTHSLVVFSVAFALVWLIRRKPLLEMGAWALHIVMDIFTHSTAFFPTPFLWPVAETHFNGVPWSHPIIFIPNVLLLAILYAWFLFGRRKPR
ncbi:MAG TPA: hypothetical protein VMH34_05720 [Gammaproteobacteria bacterium]|nr:hypothetical protein [Gammaproteobacteria bacterium]